MDARSERLIEILADMVCSALAWERENGGPPNPVEHGHNGLTVYPICIQSGAHRTPPNGGREHDDDDFDESNEQPTTDP